MNRFNLATVGGVMAVLVWAGAANAQYGMDSYGGYPVPPGFQPGQGGTSYVAAPGLTGPGSTYSYVQQNPGARMGMSPNTYYSMNYFTPTPMTAGAPMTTRAPYVYNNRSAYSSNYGNPGVPMTQYSTPTTSPSYSSANATYYRNRRVGPFRRLFGRP